MKKILGLLLLLAGVASICAKAVDPQEALITAIEDKNIDGVKKALEDGADPNKETPLVREGKVVIHGKEVSREMLPLNLAIEKRDSEIISLLLKNNANPNASGKRGVLPIVHAILQQPTMFGDRQAYEKDIENIVKMLLDAGADPSIRNENDLTPLDIAKRSHNLEVVKVLRRALQEALITAIEDKNLDGVEKALKGGADSNGGIEEKVMTEGKEEYKIRLPLNMAVKSDDPAIVKLLLKHKANPNNYSGPGDPRFWGDPVPVALGFTPLELLAKSKDKKNTAEIFTMLLDGGAKPSAESELGVTPLNMAAFTGNKKVVELLLKRGVDPNVLTKLGTALMRAAEAGRKEVVRLLLDNPSIKPEIKNDKGKTAADLAETDEIRDMIERKAAD